MTEFASIDKLQFSFQASGDDLKLTKESAFLLDIVSKQQFGGYALNDKKEITTQDTSYATIEQTFDVATFNSTISSKLAEDKKLQLHTDRPIYKHTDDSYYVVFKGNDTAAKETATKFILIDCTKEIAIAKYSGNEAARAISGGTRKRRARRKPSKTPKRHRRKKV